MDGALERQLAAIQLADWRRRIAELYATVRAAMDPAASWEIWRGARDQLFADHPQSPIPRESTGEFGGLSYFEYDPAFRFLVEVAPLEAEAEAWDIGQDGILRPRPVVRTRGLEARLGGELIVFWLTAYSGGLFLPFADAASGIDTYVGGRYLIDSVKGADLGLERGRMILDFNFAYYPSCAHDTAWTCPLAPRENRLSRRVDAGQNE